MSGDINPADIVQGPAGDCWFISSLCSFANYVVRTGKTTLLDKIMQKADNTNTKDVYIFKVVELEQKFLPNNLIHMTTVLTQGG